MQGRADGSHGFRTGKPLPVFGVDGLKSSCDRSTPLRPDYPGTALPAHGSDDAMFLADTKPSGRSIVVATVGMYDGPGAIGQSSDRLGQHGVRQTGV